MPFCHPESEAKAARHRGLGKQKGLVGLPSIAFLTADGEVVVQVPPAVHTVARFERYLARARQLLAWREAAAKGDVRAAASLLIAMLEERQLDRTQALARRAALHDETATERARLDELLLDLRIGEELRAAGQDLEQRRALGKRYLAAWAAGPRPSPDVSRGHWFVILEHAEAAQDVDGYAVGLEGLRGNVARTADGAEWGIKMLAEYERTLARLRAPRREAGR